MSLLAEIDKYLETITNWHKRDGYIEGGVTVDETRSSGGWNVKVFPTMALDLSRSCEVMVTGKHAVVRLPPELAEKWLRVAEEKVKA